VWQLHTHMYIGLLEHMQCRIAVLLLHIYEIVAGTGRTGWLEHFNRTGHIGVDVNMYWNSATAVLFR
jgi:hypothetical protein